MICELNDLSVKDAMAKMVADTRHLVPLNRLRRRNSPMSLGHAKGVFLAVSCAARLSIMEGGNVSQGTEKAEGSN